MNIKFLTLAQQEVDDAVVWFEGREAGKGIDFLDELDRVVRLIRSFPTGVARNTARDSKVFVRTLSLFAHIRARE